MLTHIKVALFELLVWPHEVVSFLSVDNYDHINFYVISCCHSSRSKLHPNIQDAAGSTLLHHAILNGHR